MDNISFISAGAIEDQYEALQMFIHRRMIEKQSLAHGIGENLLKLIETSRAESIDENSLNSTYVAELGNMKRKLEKEFGRKFNKLKVDSEQRLKRELEQQKQKNEEIIDHIMDIHSQSETTKLAAQRRQFEEELKLKVNRAVEDVESKMKAEFEQQRAQQYDIFYQQFQGELKAAVCESQDTQKFLFEAEKENLIKEIENETQSKIKKVEITCQEKLKKGESFMKLKYQQICNEYESAIKYHKIIETDYQDLQGEFRKFLDSTDGYLSSDYLLVLRSHAIQKSEKKLQEYRTLLETDIYENQ